MATSRGTLLLVENNEPLREALADVLADEGYEILLAGNGCEALAQLRRGARPSLILLDLLMPVMDGPTFLARRREDPELSRVPVLVVTADKRHDEAHYAALADGFLWKPFIIEELLRTVERLARPAAREVARAA